VITCSVLYAEPPAVDAGRPAAPHPDVQEQKAPPRVIELRWTAVNTNASLNLENGQTHYSLRFSGQVKVPDQTPILAVSNLILLEHVLDRLGNDLLEAPEGFDPQPTGIQTVRHFNGIHAPPGGAATIHVSAMLNGINGLPSVIRTLRGKLNVLLAESTTTVELDATETMKTVREISGRVGVQLVKIQRRNNVYEIELKWRLKHSDADNRTYYSNLKMIRKVVIEDDAGNRLEGQPGGRTIFRRTRDASEGAHTYSFELGADRKAKILEVDMVTKIRATAIEVGADNIPLPGAYESPGL